MSSAITQLPPVRVYLDSSDYSTLSDPRRQTPQVQRLRARLVELARDGSVAFVFSGVHLSEMAPIEGQYARAAIDRADMLVALCQRNTLISFDRLLSAELANLASRDEHRVSAFSLEGEWYPDLSNSISPLDWADTARAIDDEVKSRGLNREQRRKLKRSLFKQSAPTALMRGWLAKQAEIGDLTDVLRLYPMRPQDAKTLARYTLGEVGRAQAEAAFLESLRDPRWMMQWFTAHHDRLTPITEWLRGPAQEMYGSLRRAADLAQELYRSTPNDDPVRVSFLSARGWRAAQGELLVRIVNQLLSKLHADAPLIRDAALVDERCPGLAAAIRSTHSALRDCIGPTPRSLQASDFVDAVHAMYAPYVTIFRADRYMATHIRKAVGHKALVVPTLIELPDEIARQI